MMYPINWRFLAILSVTGLLYLPLSVEAESLREIYQLSLENDPTLKAAEATFNADKELENIARANLLPQLRFSASYSQIDSEQVSLVPEFDDTGFLGQFPSSNDSDIDREVYSADLRQAIIDLPAWFNFKRGKKLSEQAETEFYASQQDLIIRVAEAYFNVLRAQDNLGSTQAEEKAAQRQLEQAQQRFDVGLAAITDVHEAQAAYDATVVLRLTGQSNLHTAFESLSVLTNKTHNQLYRLNKHFTVSSPEPALPQSWVDIALDNNFQLQSATAASEASNALAQAQKSEHLPKLSASITHSDTSDDGDTNSSRSPVILDTDSDGESTVFALNLDWPLFLGGATSANRRRAQQQHLAAKENLVGVQRSIIQQTRSLFVIVSTDVQRVKANAQAIVSSQSALDATQAGYDVGTRNIVDLLQSQRNLYASQRDHANSRYDYIVNLLKLKQLAGTLSPDDILTLDAFLSLESK